MTTAVKERKVKKLKTNTGFSDYKRQTNIQLTILALPMIIYLLIFKYLPMPGIAIAFQDYSYTGGLFGSKFVGLENFEYIFRSSDAFRILRNTIVHNVIFIITGNMFSLLVALLMDRVVHRWQIKTFQTMMFLPYFISWVVVSYMSSIVLAYDGGILNSFLEILGKEPVSWYMSPGAWWFIIPIAHLWKSIGHSSIVYYGYILGVDNSLYEAAYIDGANEWQKMLHITIPMIKPAIVLNLIMSVGRLMRGDFGLFYYLTNDSGMLYPSTDIIDTYVFRGLRKTGDISGPAAIGLLQSVVGFILVVGSNKISKWLDPENRMF